MTDEQLAAILKASDERMARLLKQLVKRLAKEMSALKEPASVKESDADTAVPPVPVSAPKPQENMAEAADVEPPMDVPAALRPAVEIPPPPEPADAVAIEPQFADPLPTWYGRAVQQADEPLEVATPPVVEPPAIDIPQAVVEPESPLLPPPPIQSSTDEFQPDFPPQAPVHPGLEVPRVLVRSDMPDMLPAPQAGIPPVPEPPPTEPPVKREPEFLPAAAPPPAPAEPPPIPPAAPPEPPDDVFKEFSDVTEGLLWKKAEERTRERVKDSEESLPDIEPAGPSEEERRLEVQRRAIERQNLRRARLGRFDEMTPLPESTRDDRDDVATEFSAREHADVRIVDKGLDHRRDISDINERMWRTQTDFDFRVANDLAVIQQRLEWIVSTFMSDIGCAHPFDI